MIGENEFTGKHIGTYKLVAEFHSGQLSSAYRAEQAGQTPQPVVLHLFHAVRLPTAKQEQFLREVRTLKKVKHPYVLPVLESGFFDDMPYIVTEYAAHGSLRDRLNQGPPPTIPEAVTIITRIGQALQFNHQVNIIHGNLKPENILFDEQGEARLADCRVMAIVDSVPIELAHNTNTYPYMAPEQFYGKTSKESDQYALGCIAYELLTGIAPFAEADFRTMGNKHRQEVLVPPTQLNMLLPSHMQAAILIAMSKQETARYLHIKDFIAALTTSARPASPAPIAIVSPALVMPVAATIPTISPEISLPQPDEAQAIHTNMVEQPERPPDTPAMNTDVEPLMPVENTPVPALPIVPDTIDADAPPVTPQPLSETPETQESQQEQNAQTVHDMPSADAHEDAGQPGQHKNFAGDDELPTLPVPAVNAVSPVNPAIPANNAFQENSLPTHADNSSVVVPTHAIQQTGFAGTNIVHDEAGHERRKLAKNFALLVGISWCIIAVIILSMIFIILPSVHIPSGKSTTIVHDPTRQPTLHPSPTTHPKAAPTPHPTPSPTLRPTPSPTPIPSPSPTPSPTPSPSPTPVLGLIVSSTSINPNTDCQNVQFGYRCTITLAVPQEYQGNVKWSTASSNLNAFFSPPRGTLSPGQRQQVIIFVRNSCPHSGDLIFQTDSTRIVVSLNC